MQIQGNEIVKQAKGFFLVCVFALGVLILTVSVINVSKNNIVGRAFYRPVEIYGEVSPALPDETMISFKVREVDVASTTLKNSSYGIEPKVFLKMDDPETEEKEGYAEGDVVELYIEGVKVVEFSYFEEWATEKNINIPASKRVEISERAAQSEIRRLCAPMWQCDTWSDCVDGMQNRRCTDIRNCGTEEGEPEESRTCIVPPTIEQPLPPRRVPTGVFIVAFLILSVLGLLTSIAKKAKKRKK